MRKTTLANLETKKLIAFRNIFAHHKNVEAQISDLVSCIPVELHTLERARIRSIIDPKTDTSGQWAKYGCVNGTGCFNRATSSKLNFDVDDGYTSQSLLFRVTLAYLAYMSMSCLTQKRGRRTISMKRQRRGFGRWALTARTVV